MTEIDGGRGRGARWPYWFVVAAPLALFAPFLAGGQVLYWGTPLLQFYPWRMVALEAVRSGQWPLWNPYVGSGAPLLANYQSALLYPPNWLALVVPLDLSLGWLGALHLVWAGVGAVTLARALGQRPLGQVVAGLSFCLSQYLVARVGFLSINATAAWLPWMIWSVERNCQMARAGEPRWRRALWALVLAACTAMLLLAGHAQTAWYTLLLAGAWGIWRLVRLARAGLRADRVAALGATLLAAVLVGTAMAAAQLLPTAELMRESPRAESADYAFVMTYSYWPWRLVTLLAPDFFGNPAQGNYGGYGNYWEDADYMGVLPLLLVIGVVAGSVGAFARSTFADKTGGGAHDRAPLQGLPLFLGAIMGVSLLLALGQNTPVFPFLYRHVPTFNLFQAPARIMLAWTFALSLAAGIGAERWRPPRGAKLYWTRLGTAGAAAMVVVAVAAPRLIDPVGAPDDRLRTMARATALAGLGLGGAGLLSLLKREPSTRRWEWAVAAFVSGDLLLAGWGLNPGAPRDVYQSQAASSQAIQAALGQGRVFQFPADEQVVKFERLLSFRAFGPPDAARAVRAAQVPNTTTLDRLPSANNFDPLVSARYAGLVELIERTQRLDLLPLLGVQVLASSQPWHQLEPVAEAPAAGVVFYRLPGEARRAWIVHEAEWVGGGEAALEAIARPDFDPWRTAILEGKPVVRPAASAGNGSEAVSLTGDLKAVTIHATLRAPGWIILADTYFPGWTVEVDGQPAVVERVDYALRGVAVEAGEHTVFFDYRPRVFRAGLWLSALGLAAAGSVTLWSLWQRKMAKDPVRRGR